MLISPPRGFSIFEVLVVISIIGISTLFVSISINTNEKKKVFNQASRFSNVVETVSDRAAIFRRPMVISLKSNSYEVKERVRGNWTLLKEGFLSPYTLEDNITISSENDEILRLQIENNKTAQEVRNIIKESCREFKALEEWE